MTCFVGCVVVSVALSLRNCSVLKTSTSEDKSTKSRQFGIYISSSYKNFKREGGPDKDHVSIGNVVSDRWKEGDRFTLIVDFERKVIKFMYNDQDLGVIFENIPQKLVPTIVTYPAIELLCTKYQLRD